MISNTTFALAPALPYVDDRREPVAAFESSRPDLFSDP
jgi:hypothetical protein